MKKRNVAVVAIAIAALLVAGSLTASNMGFKLNRVLNGTASSKSGTNYVALPFNKQVGLSTAGDLIADIEATGADVAEIQKYVNVDDSFVGYNGSSGADFGLTKDAGYIVAMNTDVNYIIVGSHDPGHVVAFNGTGSSKSGTNYYAVPYHTTATSAGDLIAEIETTVGADVAEVQKYVNVDDSFVGYNGSSGADFDLSPGQSYVVSMNTDVSFTPSHY